MAQGAQHRLDVAVRQRAIDEEGLGGGDEALAGQRAADDIDERVGEVGEVAEGFVFDLAAEAEGAAEQVGGIGFAFIVASSCGYMNCSGS